jgi:hypothetical protein
VQNQFAPRQKNSKTYNKTKRRNKQLQEINIKLYYSMMTALNGYTEELKNNQKTSQKALM